MTNEGKHEVINEMKSLLSFMQQKNIHESELSNYPPEKQREIFNFLTSELESMFSFQVIINQIKEDTDTTLGNLQ